MADLTAADRAALTRALPVLERLQTRLNELERVATSNFNACDNKFKAIEATLNQLNRRYIEAQNRQNAVLKRARQQNAKAFFGGVLQAGAIIVGYPGNTFTLGVLSLGLSSLGQELQPPPVPSAHTPGQASLTSPIRTADLAQVLGQRSLILQLDQIATGRALLGMARDLLVLSRVMSRIGAINASLSQTYISVNQLLGGRAGKGVVPADVVAAATAASAPAVKQSIDSVARELAKAHVLLNHLSKAQTTLASALAKTGVDEMERLAWIVWIADLQMGTFVGYGRYGYRTVTERNADVLDIDSIENHLAKIHVIGPNSRLGVNFGGYTSDSDENAAVRAAFKKVYPKRPTPRVGDLRWQD